MYFSDIIYQIKCNDNPKSKCTISHKTSIYSGVNMRKVVNMQIIHDYDQYTTSDLYWNVTRLRRHGANFYFQNSIYPS